MYVHGQSCVKLQLVNVGQTNRGTVINGSCDLHVRVPPQRISTHNKYDSTLSLSHTHTHSHCSPNTSVCHKYISRRPRSHNWWATPTRSEREREREGGGEGMRTKNASSCPYVFCLEDSPHPRPHIDEYQHTLSSLSLSLSLSLYELYFSMHNNAINKLTLHKELFISEPAIYLWSLFLPYWAGINSEYKARLGVPITEWHVWIRPENATIGSICGPAGLLFESHIIANGLSGGRVHASMAIMAVFSAHAKLVCTA